MNALPVLASVGGKSSAAAQRTEQFVTVKVVGQSFGIAVLSVQDVLRPHHITCIPLAPHAVAGALNLRGRIVTAIDLRVRLGLPSDVPQQRCMSVVVEHKGELYSLLVESVGEVLTLPLSIYEKNPAHLDPAWHDVCSGIFRLDGELLVILDVERLLQLPETRMN